MVFKLVRTDSVEPCKIMLEVGKHLIGRGKFLDCDDKRVSRNHGELEVTEDTVIIRALHQNPCFVIKKSTKETEILKQNCTLNISNGDRFGLLPNSYWYELLHCTVSDVAQPTKPLSTMTEGDIELDSVETEPFETENADVSQEIKFNFDETVTNDNPESPSLIAPEEVDLGIETIVTTGIDQNNRSESEEQTLIKRAHSSEDIKDPSIVKKIKTTPEQNKTEEGVQIKQEPVDNEDLKNPKAGPSNDQGVSSASKDNAAANSPDAAAPAKPLGRERCMYGENCYRRNLQHKAQFSHPGDADWGAGARGQCPWGAACRRRDQRHWRDHDHPQGARPPNDNPGNKRKRPTKRYSESDNDAEDDDDEITPLVLNNKRTRKTINRQNDWDDSDSIGEEDPYATDDEDSEWQPQQE